MDKLVSSLQAALKDLTFVANLARLATGPVPENRATPEALCAHLKGDIDWWGPIIRKAGIYAD